MREPALKVGKIVSTEEVIRKQQFRENPKYDELVQEVKQLKPGESLVIEVDGHLSEDGLNKLRNRIYAMLSRRVMPNFPFKLMMRSLFDGNIAVVCVEEKKKKPKTQ